MDFENMNIWCWLIPLLVGVICGILGYLLGKSGQTTIDHSAELKVLQDKNAKLQADLDACTQKVSTSGTANLGASVASFAAGAAVASLPFDAAAAKAAMGVAIKQDDLKVVEGIGPKIEGMFKDAGIKTWQALSESSVADCQKILDTGGTRYQVHDPASWPMQAKMCYEGKWKELAKWQQEHKHGKL
jgi:predicted flap endonuclease-1-like 5' DNA nuclease